MRRNYLNVSAESNASFVVRWVINMYSKSKVGQLLSSGLQASDAVRMIDVNEPGNSVTVFMAQCSLDCVPRTWLSLYASYESMLWELLGMVAEISNSNSNGKSFRHNHFHLIIPASHQQNICINTK